MAMRLSTLLRLSALPLAVACGDTLEPDEGCPTPTGEGTHHAGPLDGDLTWTAEDGPHHVDGTVQIADGATLTVEACAEVRLAGGAGIEVGERAGGAEARLEVRGEAGRPVRFVRADPGAAWTHVAVYPGASAALAHAELVGGGADDTAQGATLYVLGDGSLAAEGAVAVEEVTIDGSAGVGALLEGAAAFAAGSTGLSVTGSGSPDRPYPLVIGQHALDSLPDGRLEGNPIDAVRVLEDLSDGHLGLRRDATLRARPEPYIVGGDAGEPFVIGGSDGTPATLTVEPGAELRFQPGTGLRVLAIGGAPIGALIAEGRPDAPIRFTSAAAVPQRGDWSNLWFEGPVHGATRLAHAEISYAGGWCSCWLTSCTPVESYEAAVIIEGPPAGVFIEDTVIRESAGHGIVRSWLDHEELDFTERNTFDGVAGCDQTWPELSDTVCPDPAYACDPQ